MLVKWRGTLVLDICVKVVEARRQGGKNWRAPSGAVGPQMLAEAGRVQLVHRCLSVIRRGDQWLADVPPGLGGCFLVHLQSGCPLALYGSGMLPGQHRAATFS